LLSFGANPNVTAQDTEDAMCQAVSSNNPEMAWLLIRGGYDFFPPTRNPAATLTAAIKNNDSRDSAEFLIAFGVDVDAADSGGLTPLMAAAQRGDALLIQRLLALGADPHKTDAGSNTALMHGASILTPETAGPLLAAGVDINQRDSRGMTALMLALRARNADLSRLLIAAGADIDQLSAEWKSALSIAIEGKMMLPLADLLAQKPDLRIRHQYGYSVLHIACRAGNHEAVTALLRAGADPNARDVFQMTPLVHALRHPQILRSLLAHDANPALRVKENKTVLDYANALPDKSAATILAAHLAQKSKSAKPVMGPG
jgi:ankyrin repeat protein